MRSSRPDAASNTSIATRAHGSTRRLGSSSTRALGAPSSVVSSARTPSRSPTATRDAAPNWLNGERESSAQLTREQEELARARTIAFGADHGRRRTAGSTESPEERARFLDAQAALAPAARARSAGERRDYRRLAGLAGYGGSEYERLDPRAQRAARLQIDRELASHRERMTRARNLAMPTSGPSRARADHPSAAVPDTSRTVGPRRTPPSDRSSVMQDAREVAAGRKRQLGRDRS